MRPRLLLMPLVAAVLLALAACSGGAVVRDAPGGDAGADRSPSGNPTVPGDPDEVFLRAGAFGGFVPVEHGHTQQPTVLVTADGRVFTGGIVPAVFPGPLVTPVNVGRASEAQMERLRTLADDAGLLATPPDYTEGEPTVTDMPYTVLDLTTADGTFHHAAYALSRHETAPARQRLESFLREAEDITMRIDAEPWRPDAVVVLALPERGGAGGEGEFRVVDWSGPALADQRCLVVDDPTLVTVLGDADQLTRFRSGDRVWRLAVRVALPGDPGCDGYRP